MQDFVPNSSKSQQLKSLLNQALTILHAVGIPFDGKSENALVRMAECFLAVAGVRNGWHEAGEQENRKKQSKTRDIISFVNQHFEENISPGSYDDIRRKHLKLLVLSGIVVNSGSMSGAATNDPTRGYSLHPAFVDLIMTFESEDWETQLAQFKTNHQSLSEALSRKRDLATMAVILPGGRPLVLSPGEHNELQKAIIEEFLPRFGSDCSVLYVGDTSNKLLYIEKEVLASLNFFELSHAQLPDIIAYSNTRNRLFLIEAVHSTGPMNEIRVLELQQLLSSCPAEVIFVTCFLTKKDFKKWLLEIAWETEVWIAENPDHMVHFNGHKFLGAH
jgi:BsuBI/PstI restriction endonuclease domain/BsuBI/PstI restriction endonuclease HTH domain